MTRTPYILGHEPAERQRLRSQDELWESETEALIDRLGLRDGARVLEIGCGVGLSLPRLARRVGSSGEVVALEPNAVYAVEARRLITQEKLTQVRVVDGGVHDNPLPEGPFDAIFARWVFSFLRNPRSALTRLHGLLGPGGVLGIIDYNHDGLRLFPDAPAFERVIEAFRAWYAKSGGDLWIAGRLPGYLHATGFHCDGLWPQQKAGPPGSATYRWIEQFVLDHGPRLVKANLLSDGQWRAFIAEWQASRLDPAAMIFSPIVVGVVARALTPHCA